MAAVKQLEMWVDDIKHDYSFDEIKMMVKRSNTFFGCVPKHIKFNGLLVLLVVNDAFSQH